MSVEIRHLEALAAIAREGSFRGAADALGYVQSAVSQQLASLERLVGTRLIDRRRGNGPLALTDAGSLLLAHTEEILARYEQTSVELSLLAAGRIGTLRVGLLQSVATHVLPQVLATFAQRSTGVSVAPTEHMADTALLAMLQEGTLDLTFCELPLPDGPFEAMSLIDDPIVLVVAAGSPLSTLERPATPADIAEQPLIAFSGWRAQSLVQRWLANQSVEHTVAFTSGHNATVQGLVAHGMGVALAPYLAVDASHPDTVVVPLADGPPPRTIALAWCRDREPSPAADAFAAAARPICEQQAAGIAWELERSRAGLPA
ncbi:LysR family transcriptional regulator [Baekduia alba]|uniref:LysR family transcriptional regulator n=1 Tax=Baekduia alba TaxID=2997333 RepID=UPI0023418829|nr:LysR family transcriptional regulator [Baekduia alba]